MAKPKPKSQPRLINKPVATATRKEPTAAAVIEAQPSRPVQKPIQLPKSVLLAISVVLALIALIPVYQYYNVVLNNAVNMPFEDDFDSGLRFISNYINAGTLADKWRLIYSQHNEHRILLNRFTFLADYALFGQLNLRHMILFGNLSLVLVLWLLFQSSFNQGSLPQKLFYFLPVPFLLFQMHYWELTVWGMAAIANLYVFVFALLSLYALSRSAEKPSLFWVAAASAVMATFTIGSGLFTFTAGAVGLTLTKQYRRLGVWVAVAAVTAGLYFLGYEKPGHHPPVFEALLKSPAQFFDYFFTLTGSDFSAKPDQPIRAGKWLLATFVGLFAWNAYKKQLSSNLTILMLLAFILITALSVTAARSGFGVAQALSPRYGILPVMLLIGLYVLSVETVKNRYLKPALVLAGLGLSVYLYNNSYTQHFGRVEDRTTNLLYSTALYNDNPENLIVYWGDPKQAKVIFLNAVKKGIYKVPAVTLTDIKSKPQLFDASVLQPTNNVISDVKPYATHDYLVFYQSWAFINGLPADQTKIQIIAQGKAGSYAFDVRRHIRYDVVNQYQSLQYLQSGFSCTLKKGDLKPGHYTLWIALTSPYAQSYVPLNVPLDV